MRTRRIKAVFSANPPVTLRPWEEPRFQPGRKEKRSESFDSERFEHSVREIISWRTGERGGRPSDCTDESTAFKYL